MPTYRFYNSKTEKEYTDLMSISEMEEFIKKKHDYIPMLEEVVREFNVR